MLRIACKVNSSTNVNKSVYQQKHKQKQRILFLIKVGCICFNLWYTFADDEADKR